MDDRADAVKPVVRSSEQVASQVPRKVGIRLRVVRNRLPGGPRASVAGLVPGRAVAERSGTRAGRTRNRHSPGLFCFLKALPEVVPGTSFRESILGQGIVELSHVEYLPQRVPIVLMALLIAAAAVGLGDLAVRGLGLAEGVRLGDASRLDYGLGAGLLGTLTLLFGRAGWLSPWPVRLSLLILAGAGLVTSRLWRAPREDRPEGVSLGACYLPVRRGHAAGFDAAVDRFRRP